MEDEGGGGGRGEGVAGEGWLRLTFCVRDVEIPMIEGDFCLERGRDVR